MSFVHHPNFLPYFYAISSNVCFIVAQLIAKMQMSMVSAMFVIYYRSVILLGLNSLIIWRKNSGVRKKMLSSDNEVMKIENFSQDKLITMDILEQNTFCLMIKRVVFACLSMVFFTLSLKNIELSITNALFQTGPIFVFFVDAIVNKIKILRIHLLLTLLSFVGVVIILMAKGKENKSNQVENQDSFHLSWYLLPLASAFTSACSMSYLHRLKDKVDPLLTVQYLMIGAILTSGLLYNVEGHNSPDSQTQQLMQSQNTKTSQFFSKVFSVSFILSTLIMSLMVFFSQYLRVKALFILPASRVAPLHYLGIILSVLIDLIIFNYSIRFWQYVGIVLAGCGLWMKFIIENGEQKRKQQDQAQSSSSSEKMKGSKLF